MEPVITYEQIALSGVVGATLSFILDHLPSFKVGNHRFDLAGRWDKTNSGDKKTITVIATIMSALGIQFAYCIQNTCAGFDWQSYIISTITVLMSSQSFHNFLQR